MKALVIICCILLAFSCRQKDIPEHLKIEWTEALNEDYAFAKTWDYPEGIYKNEHGQLSCDGFCPERTDAMKDSTGRIYNDSLSVFYALVDTTHRFHTLQGSAQCDEYAGSDYMVAHRKHDTVFCYSLCDAATHCSLHFRLHGNDCVATAELQSVAAKNKVVYNLHKGSIRIDPTSLKEGVLKAEFDLDFGKDRVSGRPVSWKGKIQTPILNE